MINYLKELSELKGPSGKEKEVRDYIKKKIEEKNISYEEDFFGNLYVYKKGKNKIDIKVGAFAHMDEVGVIVIGYTSDGFLKIRPIGGVEPEILPGVEIVFVNGIKGVVSSVPPHKKENIKYNKFSDIIVDIGAYSREEAKQRVPPGTEGVFDTKFENIGEKIYKGKAFDDRAGSAILLSVILEEEIPFDTTFIFTCQEETGLVGARIASERINFDLAFILEGTFAFEPYHPEEEYYPRMGKGPVVTKMDRSLIVDEAMLSYVQKAAEKFNIPFQWKIPLTGATDGGMVSLTNRGVKTCVIAVPCRYIHSKASLLYEDDLINTEKLFLKTMEVIYEENFKGIV